MKQIGIGRIGKGIAAWFDDVAGVQVAVW
jgi:hypothetical protein